MTQPTPWRIAAQSYTVLDPQSKEPALTLQFIVDHAQADMMKLRITPTDPAGSALELTFSTGGFVSGEPVMQPRWLKAFERPDPNLYLFDDDAAKEYAAGLSDAQRGSWEAKRKGYLDRRAEWQKVHGAGQEGPVPAGEQRGPDSTDPADPLAEQGRAARAGVDVTQPADADRKGMASQPPGGQAGEAAASMQAEKPNAPNAVDQQRQKQGVDTSREKVEAGPA